MVFGAPLPFAAEPRLPDFTFFMRAMLQELPLHVHASDHLDRAGKRVISEYAVDATAWAFAGAKGACHFQPTFPRRSTRKKPLLRLAFRGKRYRSPPRPSKRSRPPA